MIILYQKKSGEIMKYLVAIILLTSFNYISYAGQGNGAVTFTGSVINAPCSILPESVEQTVDLGEVSLAKLSNNGSNNGVTTSVPFSISLEECTLSPEPALNTVTATFTGTASNTTGNLAVTGSAKGVSIKLFNEDSTPLELGTFSQPKPILDGNNTLFFSAALAGDGLSILPGDFSATARFELDYF